MKGRPIKILYVFNKQPGYARIKILRSALAAHAEVDCIGSERKTYLRRTLEVLWKFFKRRSRDHDILVVGFFGQLLMPLLRSFWWGPVMADCYISLFDSYVNDRALASGRSLRGRLCHWLDGYLLRHADIALTDTQSHATYLAENYPVEARRIRPIPISADETLFPRLPQAKPPDDHGCFEVLFFGAFIPLQGVETIIRAAHRLDAGQFRFRFIGEGQTFASCRALASRLGVENIRFEGWKKVETIAAETEGAHLVLGIFGKTEKAKRVIPNKVFEALSMGRPLVTGNSVAMRDYFSDGENIFLVPFDDPDALAKKIILVKNNYAYALEVADAGHRLFAERLSPKAVSRMVGEALEELV